MQLFYRVAGSKKLQRLDIIGKDTIEDTILTSYGENEPANSVIQLAAMFCEKKKKKEDAPAGTVVAGKARATIEGHPAFEVTLVLPVLEEL